MTAHWKGKVDCNLPSQFGTFKMRVYQPFNEEEQEPVAIVAGDVQNRSNVLIRIHSECVTSEVFGSKRCDCRQQLEHAMQQISESPDGGIVIYLRQEGRGIGLYNKIRAYELQDRGYDTLQANLELGLPADARTYEWVGEILRDFAIDSVRIMTNNPDKVGFLEESGVVVTQQIPIQTGVCEENYQYLKTKKEQMGHHLLNL